MDCEYSAIRDSIKLRQISLRTTLYGDNTTLEKSMDCTIETVTSDYSDLSVGNVFNKSGIEIYNISDDIVYSITMPKMTKGRMETPATICIVYVVKDC